MAGTIGDPSISAHIDKLRHQASTAASAADKLELLAMEFPDLRRWVGRWEKEAFYSSAVNARATGYEQRYNCGCCSDSPLEIWPYTEHEGTRSETQAFPMF